MRLVSLAGLLVGLVALAGLAAQPVTLVRAVTGAGEVLACERVAPGTTVELTFTHSMYGGFVRETYRVTSEPLLARESIVAEHAAAAEYYATDGRTRRVDGGHEVLAPPYATDSLVIRVDARGDHWLAVGATRYHLAGMLDDPTQVRLVVERASSPGWRSPCG
jgi:hypothetical protein